MKANNKDDKKRFGVALYWLAERMPLGRDKEGRPIPRELTVQLVSEYFEALADLPIAQIEAGVKYHYGHSEFWPNTPGALRKSCEAVPKPRQGWLPPPPPRPQLPEMPISRQKDLMKEIMQGLNGTFGTSFSVDEEGTLKGNAQGRRRDRK